MSSAIAHTIVHCRKVVLKMCDAMHFVYSRKYNYPTPESDIVVLDRGSTNIYMLRSCLCYQL